MHPHVCSILMLQLFELELILTTNNKNIYIWIVDQTFVCELCISRLHLSDKCNGAKKVPDNEAHIEKLSRIAPQNCSSCHHFKRWYEIRARNVPPLSPTTSSSLLWKNVGEHTWGSTRHRTGRARYSLPTGRLTSTGGLSGRPQRSRLPAHRQRYLRYWSAGHL